MKLRNVVLGAALVACVVVASGLVVVEVGDAQRDTCAVQVLNSEERIRHDRIQVQATILRLEAALAAARADLQPLLQHQRGLVTAWLIETERETP